MYRSIEDPLDDHSIQNTEDKIHTNCKTRIHAFLRTNWLWLLLLVGLSFGFSYIFTLPYCGWLFQCGCTWVWAGGVKKYVRTKFFFLFTSSFSCNIFQPNSPHCPWCVTHVILSNIPLWGTPFLMIFVTATLSFYFPRHRFKNKISNFLFFLPLSF